MDEALTGVGEASDAVEDATIEAPDGPADGIDGISALLAALEEADDLPLDERLALLRSAEENIAGALEGLDGL